MFKNISIHTQDVCPHAQIYGAVEDMSISFSCGFFFFFFSLSFRFTTRQMKENRLVGGDGNDGDDGRNSAGG